MNHNFKDIRVLLWDLDGTLYKSLPELNSAIYKALIKILQEHKNLSFDDAVRLFEETRKIHKGSTRSLQALGCGDRISIIRKLEKLVNKASFLKTDPKLQFVFQELYCFQHIIVSDTTHQTIVAELEALGLSHTIFNHIVGVDDTGTTKPDRSFFIYVLQRTGLPAKNHLVIGDRLEVDLLPARALGMKTCLVWTEEKTDQVDVILPSVYDIIDLFEDPA